jgi:enamine deaminase RidA (YjgF/YER057c/UK114 family)
LTSEELVTIERLNPDGLSKPAAYSHVVRASGGTTVYLAGQTPIDADGRVVGEGDFAVQARQVFSNLRTALASVGADFSHLVRTTTYIVSYSTDLREALQAARSEAFGEIKPASTLLGVAALANPAYLIEIEGIAVIPD